jgi:hypothetical protein
MCSLYPKCLPSCLTYALAYSLLIRSASLTWRSTLYVFSISFTSPFLLRSRAYQVGVIVCLGCNCVDYFSATSIVFIDERVLSKGGMSAIAVLLPRTLVVYLPA